MDQQIERKHSILRELKRRQEEGNLTQHDIMDLRQELERCNHIQLHMIRGYVNPAGRYAAIAVFGAVGFSYWLSQIGSRSRVLTLRNVITLFPAVLVPSVVGFLFARRRLGDKKEARRLTEMHEDSLEVDNQFYDIVDNIKKASLRH